MAWFAKVRLKMHRLETLDYRNGTECLVSQHTSYDEYVLIFQEVLRNFQDIAVLSTFSWLRVKIFSKFSFSKYGYCLASPCDGPWLFQDEEQFCVLIFWPVFV